MTESDELNVLSKRGYYNILKLDSGGQANVYKITKQNRLLACKVVRVGGRDGRLEDDLKRELTITRNSKQPNIIRILDLFRTKNKVYIVMDFMPNGTVGSYVRKNNGMSEYNATVWFCPIARAVKYLHDNDVAHRDVKLDNILLDKHWNPILTDFGFSRFVRKDPISQKVDKSDTFCGTPSYNPPEIVSKKEYNPFKADVWCLGISLFVMINREYPFDKTNKKKMIENQWKRNYVFRDRVDSQISDDLKDLIHNLLEPNFLKRIDMNKVCNHFWFPIDQRFIFLDNYNQSLD